MLENFTWNFFEKTGSIETYLEYINIKNSNVNNENTKMEDAKVYNTI